jgi:hypothetical protein
VKKSNLYKLGQIAIFLLIAAGVWAQNTIVSATVSDLSGQTWNNGNYNITFIPTPGRPGPYTFNGAPFSPTTYSGVMNPGGFFTVTVPDNNFITPAGSQWNVTVCPNASFSCHPTILPINGGSVDLSSAISSTNKAIAFSPTPVAFGYSTAEPMALPGVGQQFFNVTTNSPEFWTGTMWVPFPTGGTFIQAGPPGTQNLTQPVNTSFNVFTSGTGSFNYNGNTVLTTATGMGFGSGVLFNPTITQTVTQPLNTSLNVLGTSTVGSTGTGGLFTTNINGQYNEELFTGATVALRVNAALTQCGTDYRQSCIVNIPTYAPAGIGWNVPTNNIMINDLRVNNGQGVFSNGQTDPLPNLHALNQLNYTANGNDPSETITTSASSTVLGCSITSNVATCTTTNPNGLTNGEAILIANMTGTPALNSNLNTGVTYTVLATGLTTTQFEFNVTAANQLFVADSGLVGPPCTFCGKNILSLTVHAAAGSTTNGSNASVTALSIQSRRDSTSTRQQAPLVLGSYCFPATVNQFCEGEEIDMGNSAAVDDNGFTIIGLRLVNTGFRSGIGIQLTDVGGTSASGWELGESLSNYHIAGIQFQSGDTTSRADEIFIPPANDTRPELQGVTAANGPQVWVIDDSGNFGTTGHIGIGGGVTNSTGFQHVIAATSCTTAAVIGSTCSIGGLWPVTWADTNYAMVCQLVGVVTGVPVIGSSGKSTTSWSAQIVALTAAAAGGAAIDCIGVHN